MGKRKRVRKADILSALQGKGRAKKGRTKAIIKRKGKGNKDGEVNLGKVRKERWRERI